MNMLPENDKRKLYDSIKEKGRQADRPSFCQ